MRMTCRRTRLLPSCLLPCSLAFAVFVVRPFAVHARAVSPVVVGADDVKSRDASPRL